MPFVWGFKVHRISKKHIIKPKPGGGLSVPNFQHYYWDANCRALVYWQDAYPGKTSISTPSWLAIEQDLPTSSLPALLFSLTKPLRAVTGNNFMVKKSVRIWYQIRKTFKLPETSVCTPVCHNHAFPPPIIDGTYKIGKNKGIVTIADLYINTFATFTQFK